MGQVKEIIKCNNVAFIKNYHLYLSSQVCGFLFI